MAQFSVDRLVGEGFGMMRHHRHVNRHAQRRSRRGVQAKFAGQKTPAWSSRASFDVGRFRLGVASRPCSPRFLLRRTTSSPSLSLQAFRVYLGPCPPSHNGRPFIDNFYYSTHLPAQSLSRQLLRHRLQTQWLPSNPTLLCSVAAAAPHPMTPQSTPD